MQLVAFKQYGVQLDATKIRKRHLRTLGFNVVNDVFADNSWYFRNALVRANYSDLTQGITETTIYLVNFFRSMLLGEEHDLRNRTMHIEWKKTQDITEIQSANNTRSKCKNRRKSTFKVQKLHFGGNGIASNSAKQSFRYAERDGGTDGQVGKNCENYYCPLTRKRCSS